MIAPSARARDAVVAATAVTVTVVVALMLGGARFRDAMRLMLPLLVISAVIFIPLTYLWWRFLGYLG